jgi:hypothetical protein
MECSKSDPVRSWPKARGAVWLAALVWFVSLTSCGAPKSGGPGGPNPPPTLGPEISLAGSSFAEMGEDWEGVLFVGQDQPLLSAEVLEGPSGMYFDAGESALRLRPTEDDLGTHELRVRGSWAAGQGELQAQIAVIGSRVVAAEQIGPAGGSIRVAATGSRLDGAELRFPVGAMSSTSLIEVEQNELGIMLPEGALSFDCEPGQAFVVPVTLSLPLDRELLSAYASSPEDMRVYHFDDLQGWIEMPGSRLVEGGAKIEVETSHFSRFAVFSGAVSWAVPSRWIPVLIGLGLLKAGVVTLQSISNAIARLNQPQRLIVLHGDGVCRPGEKAALIVHGLLSSAAAFVEAGGLADGLTQRYSDIFAYEYPSGGSIIFNALGLSQAVGGNVGLRFREGSTMDIYAHSMGGLVSRFCLETAFVAGMWGRGVSCPSLATLGTPHYGSTASVPEMLADNSIARWILKRLRFMSRTQGFRDLMPRSSFISWSRGSMANEWVDYHLVAGNEGGDSDGVVSMTSALPLHLPAKSRNVVPYGHSEMHQKFNQGVGHRLAAAVTIKRYYYGGWTLSPPIRVSTSSGGLHEDIRFQVNVSFRHDFVVPPLTVLAAKVEAVARCPSDPGREDRRDLGHPVVFIPPIIGRLNMNTGASPLPGLPGGLAGVVPGLSRDRQVSGDAVFLDTAILNNRLDVRDIVDCSNGEPEYPPLEWRVMTHVFGREEASYTLYERDG